MKAVADYLRQTLQEVLPALQAISEEGASIKPLPHKWSKKEILGHLIDSATNNHHKFVRTMAQSHIEFVGYVQDFWVAEQQYNSRAWQDILRFWYAYNLHLAHIIESVNPAYLQNTISIEGSKPFTLAFIMEDYVEHMKHHLKVILPNAGITNKFQYVYDVAKKPHLNKELIINSRKLKNDEDYQVFEDIFKLLYKDILTIEDFDTLCYGFDDESENFDYLSEGLERCLFYIMKDYPLETFAIKLIDAIEIFNNHALFSYGLMLSYWFMNEERIDMISNLINSKNNEIKDLFKKVIKADIEFRGDSDFNKYLVDGANELLNSINKD